MSDQYTCAPQQRILTLLTVMAGHEVHGLAPSEIAQAQQCSAAIVTRDLANLRQAGMAEQVPETNRWRLAPRIVQIAVQHQVALDRAERRLSETRQRYSRTTL
jgi:DNA-binding IclR family transcriptional regulator